MGGYEPSFAKQYSGLPACLAQNNAGSPRPQKCEWFTRDGPQLFVAITLICTGSVATKPPLASTILFPLCFLHVVMTCCHGLLGFICVLRCPFKALLRFKDMTTLGVSLTENSSYLQALSIRAEGVSRIFVLHLLSLKFLLSRKGGRAGGLQLFANFWFLVFIVVDPQQISVLQLFHQVAVHKT